MLEISKTCQTHEPHESAIYKKSIRNIVSQKDAAPVRSSILKHLGAGQVTGLKRGKAIARRSMK